jgi:CheY-like chemotaxis protein
MSDQTILLAEDDNMIRSFVCSVLQAHGYRVLPADDGMKALYLAKRVGADGIDLVLTDLDMPALNGIQLVRCLKQLRPGLKILYMTGYRGAIVDQLWDEGMVIEKPFSYPALIRAVAACLAQEVSLPARV